MPQSTAIETDDGRRLFTGCLKPQARPMTLHLGDFIDSATVTPKVSVTYSPKAMAAIKRMYLNDTYGCCVISDVFHDVGIWSGNLTGTPVVGTDAEVKKIYFHFSPRDSGCVITQVLDYWAAYGIMVGGQIHKIDGYVAVDWRNVDLIKIAIDLFGGVRLACDLPRAWANTTDGQVWDLTNSATVGGHDIYGCDYDAEGVTISTWGVTRKVTWRALTNSGRFTEAYAALSPDWYNSSKVAVSGLDVASLQSALKLLEAGKLPPIAPPIDWSDWAA